MSMFNRFSSFQSAVEKAVSGAVQGVQGMLGEEFTKNYELPRDSTASGGHELAWKIFPAVSKKTSQEMSIFVFDKDDLKKWSKRKDEQERFLDVLRQDMRVLRQLRHPHVLKVEEVFEESRRTLSFATERVNCSLANACKNFTNVANVTPEVLDIGLTDFELACGLMHIGEALSFLHREGRRVHLSVSPQSVFITPKGEWKLGGMGFCRTVEPGKMSRSEYFSMDSSTGIRNQETGRWEGSWEPPIEYSAPEVVAEPRQFNSSADMFSLGLLVFELFVPPRADGGRNSVLDVQDGNRMTHQYKCGSLHPIKFPQSVPVPLQNTIRTLLDMDPTKRPEARAFLSSPFFDSGPIKTLRTLQTLVEQEPAAQAKFLNGLPEQIDGFSTRVLRDMVLPGLQAAVINKAVAPFVITPLLKIVAKVDKITFLNVIAPMMVPLLQITEPVQCMLMFVSDLESLIPKAEDGYIRDHIVPMLCRALDSTVPEILDTVLNKIVDQASLFEYRILKQFILPRVSKLILEPPQATVRVNALLWLGKSFHVFDKDLLIEEVLPTLAQTIQLDKSPPVLMCILACYDNLGKHLGPEFVAKLILPAVAPLLWEKSLNNTQFDSVCEKIQDMLKAVIGERDKMFMAESAVKSVTAGVPVSSGFSSAVKAAEASKEESSGMTAVNKMLAEEFVPVAKREESGSMSSSAEPNRPNKYSDDPFYIGGSNSSRRTHSNPSVDRQDSSSSSTSTSRTETFAASGGRRRQAKRGNRARRNDEKSSESELLDLPTSQPSTLVDTSSSMLSNLSMSSGASTAGALVPAGNTSMFSGMNMGSSAATPTPGYPAQSYGNTASTSGQLNQYNTNAMALTPYGLQAQPPQTMGMNMNMGMGMGMPQQPQAYGGYPAATNMGVTSQVGVSTPQYPSSQPQNPQDKFSAFDNLGM